MVKVVKTSLDSLLYIFQAKKIAIQIYTQDIFNRDQRPGGENGGDISLDRLPSIFQDKIITVWFAHRICLIMNWSKSSNLIAKLLIGYYKMSTRIATDQSSFSHKKTEQQHYPSLRRLADLCRNCGKTEETPKHFFSDYPGADMERWSERLRD